MLAAWAKRLEAAKWRRSLHWFRNYAFLCGNHYPNFRWNGDSLQMNVSTFDQSASVSGARASVDQYVPKVADNQIIRLDHTAEFVIWLMEIAGALGATTTG